MPSNGSRTESPSGEVRLANAINVTMASLLAMAVLGAAIWMFTTEMSRVGAIYRSLSNQQQRDLSVFCSSLMLIPLWISWAPRTVADWLKRRRKAA